MPRPLYLLCCLSFSSLLASSARAVEPSAAEFATSRRWIAARLGSSPNRELPFSFTLRGKKSGDLLPSWKSNSVIRAIDQRRTERTLTYIDPKAALAVCCITTIYRDFPAVEWVPQGQDRYLVDRRRLVHLQRQLGAIRRQSLTLAEAKIQYKHV